jgi:hypothetical protein
MDMFILNKTAVIVALYPTTKTAAVNEILLLDVVKRCWYGAFPCAHPEPGENKTLSHLLTHKQCGADVGHKFGHRTIHQFKVTGRRHPYPEDEE